jgi:hypothetical protein
MIVFAGTVLGQAREDLIGDRMHLRREGGPEGRSRWAGRLGLFVGCAVPAMFLALLQDRKTGLDAREMPGSHLGLGKAGKAGKAFGEISGGERTGHGRFFLNDYRYYPTSIGLRQPEGKRSKCGRV